MTPETFEKLIKKIELICFDSNLSEKHKADVIRTAFEPLRQSHEELVEKVTALTELPNVHNRCGAYADVKLAVYNLVGCMRKSPFKAFINGAEPKD